MKTDAIHATFAAAAALATAASCSALAQTHSLQPYAYVQSHGCNGVEWYVVECERHFDDINGAVIPSFNFLKSKGRI